MFRSISLVALGAVGALLTSATSNADQTPPSATITFSMHAENGSKLEGIATVADAGEPGHPALMVTLLYANTMFIPELQYPTEIRTGVCGNVNSQHAYALNPVQGGRSATTLKGLALAKLLAHPYSINVHAANAIERYLSCGEILRAPPQTPSPAAR